MNLDDSQMKQVAAWVAEGLKLSEVQKRLETELGIRITYMELRFLIDDLKVMPKDPERPEPTKAVLDKNPPKPGDPLAVPAHEEEVQPMPPDAETWPADEGVMVKVDAVTRPGALVSGSVRFSDGQIGLWYLDQMGRLGLAPQQQGYRPSPGDLQTFQTELQIQLQKMGF